MTELTITAMACQARGNSTSNTITITAEGIETAEVTEKVPMIDIAIAMPMTTILLIVMVTGIVIAKVIRKRTVIVWIFGIGI